MYKQRSETVDRAVRLYLFMLRYWVDNGYTPTVREMCGALDVSSTATAQHYLDILIRWGWIERRVGIRTVGLIRASERGDEPGAGGGAGRAVCVVGSVKNTGAGSGLIVVTIR